MGWRRLLVAWLALSVAVSHASANTDSGKECTCSGLTSRFLDCSSRGRSIIRYKDFCPGRNTRINFSRNLFTTFPFSLDPHTIEVYISRNQLTTLPRAPPLSTNTTILDLSVNKISEASNELRSLSALKTLDVSYNQLQTLSFLPETCVLERLSAQRNAIRSLHGPLRKCFKMQSLDLSHNQLTSLPPGAFAGLRKLQNLKLVAAGFLNLSAGDFVGLQELKDLDLSTNNLTVLPSGIFSPLKNLGKLNLEGNIINILPDFTGLQQLRWISLRGNKLTTLPRGAFSVITNVNYLRLNENQLKSLPEGIFSGLQKLEYINFHTNYLEMLPQRLFEGSRSMKFVSFSKNRLDSLPAVMFSGISSIKDLFLRANRLSSFPPEFFKGMTSITNLDVSHNRFSTLNGSDLTGLKTIANLDITNNQFVTLPAYSASWPDINLASFGMNKIVNVSESLLRSWLGTGDKKRVLSLGHEPLLSPPVSLRWALNDKQLTTTVSGYCKCGELKLRQAKVQFCVAVSCSGTNTSWVDAVRASS